MEYHRAKGTIAAREKILPGSDPPEIAIFFPKQDDTCILVPRDGAFQTAILDDWQSQGYTLKMDGILYRTLFARYDVTAPLRDHAQIGNLFFHFLFVNQQPQ
jgi:hypothetical protein